MWTLDKEQPEAYARRRANETGRTYLITMQGHVFLDVPGNRAIADFDCGGIAGIIKPTHKESDNG